jgi:hypothetical protein
MNRFFLGQAPASTLWQQCFQPTDPLNDPVPSCRHRFSPSEDQSLISLVRQNGACKWQSIASLMPGRTARQCRDRFMNYLTPNLSRDPWTTGEDQVLLEKFKEVGPHWSRIAPFLPGRSANAVKNRWYTHLQQPHQDSGVALSPEVSASASAEAANEGFPPPCAVGLSQRPKITAGSFLSMLLNP